MSIFRRLAILLWVVLTIGLGSVVFASSDVVNFSAYLANSSGALNGSYPLTVQLLDSSKAVLWQETHTQTFTKGSFTLPIGAGTHTTALTPTLVSQITISGGTINGTTIGGTTAASGKFSTLFINGVAAGKLATANTVSASDISGTIANTKISGLGSIATQNSESITISGGTINGTTIGGTTAASGKFSTLFINGVAAGKLATANTVLNTDVTGLGTMSTQEASAVSITGGTLTGVSATANRLNVSSEGSGRAVLYATSTGSNSAEKILSLEFSAISSPATTNHFIEFKDSSRVLGSINGNGASSPSLAYMYDSSKDAVAFSNTTGIVLSSSGADYAEYILKENSSEKFTPCDIVGIRNGRIVRSTQAADQYMVISQKPIVIGNTPQNTPVNEFELVSFVGQVYVKVKQTVHSGQYIVASQTDPGIGIPKSLADLTESDIRRIVGRAWENSVGDKLRVVKVGITASVLPPVKQSGSNADLQKQVDDLKDSVRVLQDSKMELDNLKIELKAMRDFLKVGTPSTNESVSK